MSLKEFLEFRKKCPICDSPNLSVHFISKKKQEHSSDNISYTVKMPLLDLSHQRQGDISYSFSLIDNAFHIDFHDIQGNKMQNFCPTSFLKKFIKLNSNIKTQYFYKLCGSCKRYNYISNPFRFDLKLATVNNSLGKIGVDTEYLGLLQKRENDYKLFRVVNYFNFQKSVIEYGYDDKINSLYTEMDASEEPLFSNFEIPLINFVSEEKMIDRLSRLIVFS